MHPRIQKAMLSLVMDRAYRFFAVLLLKLKIVADPTCKTFWIDGVSMGYNPAYLDQIDDLEVQGVLAHEVLHPALGHIFRVAGRDPEIANMAGDYAINPYVVASGLTLPKGASLDPKYQGSLEENYAQLMKEREQQQKSGAGQGQGQDQQQSQDPNQTAQSGPQQGQPGTGQGSNPANGADGTNGQGDPQQSDFDPGCGEVRPFPGDAAAQAKAEAEWKVSVMQAVKDAMMAGNAPGWLQAVAEMMADPGTDWRALLLRFAQSAAPADYTYLKPNRRYLHMGLYMPSLHDPALEDLVFVRDTSGSLWSETQNQFTAEVVNVFETLKPKRLVVIDCDVAVTQVQVFERGDPIEIQPARGGGGTSFVAPFIRVGEEGINPACLVYLTDMDGSFPQEDPGYPVLWASTTPLRRAKQAPFGEMLEVIC